MSNSGSDYQQAANFPNKIMVFRTLTKKTILTRRVMEHTSFYVRAASGTSSTVSESGDTTTSDPMTVGIQVNIPLSSPKEQREFAQQALAEATRIDEVRNRALTDLGKLRELEAERAAGQERLDFHKSKADWVQERIKKGFEGDVEKLWESAQKQNTEAGRRQAAGPADRRPAAPGGPLWVGVRIPS